MVDTNNNDPSMTPNANPKPAATLEDKTAEKAPKFSAKVSRKFTGKIQYRTNGPASGTTAFGTVLRGEVKEVRNQKLADSLVSNGDFAHVDDSTEIGQPEQFKATAKTTTTTTKKK
jgi:hypothetical protein